MRHDRFIARKITGHTFSAASPEYDVYFQIVPTTHVADVEAAYVQPPGSGKPSTTPVGDVFYMFDTLPSPMGVERALPHRCVHVFLRKVFQGLDHFTVALFAKRQSQVRIGWLPRPGHDICVATPSPSQAVQCA